MSGLGKHSFRLIALALLAALVLTQGVGVIAAPGAPAAPVPAQDPDPATTTVQGDVVSAPARETVSDVDAYWTPERMAAAVPMLPELEGPPPEAGAMVGPQAGTPHMSPPSGGGRELAGGVGAQSASINPLATWYTYAPPYDSYEEFGKTKKYPLSTIGKLFFTQYGINYVCSGAVVWDNVVYTAGHCVHAGDNSGGGWSYNVKFVPAYKNGDAPLGSWKGLSLTTTFSWFASSDFRYDLGAIAIKPKSGVDIGDSVGWLGFWTDYGYPVHWNAYGYPAAFPFDGQVMWTCQASTSTEDTSMGTPYTVGMGCNMTGGSSGGPWILYHSKYGGWVNGVNSYKYTGFDEQMFSPYFGADAWEVFCFAAGFEPGGC